MSFQNCKIVGVGVEPNGYHSAAQAVPRGSKDFVLSPSSLREFAHCPARWMAGYVPPESDAKDYGSLLDCLLLTPQQFAARYTQQPATYLHHGMKCQACGSITDSQKCAKCKRDRVPCDVEKEWTNQSDTCQKWTKDQKAAGREVVTGDELADAQAAVARFRKDDILAAFLDASDKQVHVRGEWRDHATGLIIPVQCLLDVVPRGDSYCRCSAGDVKTTRGAIPGAWQKWSSQRGYHLQGAFDLDILNAAEKRPEVDIRDTWCFLVQENFAPWQPARYILSQAKLDCGRVMYQNYLARYARCLATGVWPDYVQNADPQTVVDGWIIDDVTPWDEAVAKNTVDRLEEPIVAPAPEMEESLP